MEKKRVQGGITGFVRRIVSVPVLWLTGLLAGCMTGFSPADWRPRVKTSEELAGILGDIRAEYKQPAMAAALIQGDDISLLAAGGNLRAGDSAPIAPGARFHVGSTTKSMTALLIAILVRDGQLSYDMPLEKALAGIPMRDEYRKVTLRQLMLSRAGIIAYQRPEFEQPAVVSRLAKRIPSKHKSPGGQRYAVARFALSREPVYPPGTKALYSNVGWSLVGLIAERAAGKSYEDLMREKIFEPLGMKSARIGGWPAGSAKKTVSNQPWGHYADKQGPRPHDLADGYVLHDWLNSAGGVHCDIRDFAVYARENLLGLQGRGRLLNREEYREIHSIHMKVPLREMYYGVKSRAKLTLGYGWAVVPAGKGLLSAADGSGGTFYARLVIFPEANAAFAGFTNSGDGAAALGEAIYRMTGLEFR